MPNPNRSNRNVRVGSQAVAVTIADACECLDVGKTKMYELIAAKRLRVVKIGKRGIRIPVSEIERLLSGGDLA